jgi:DNA polymerase elongation subunit (family B)
MSKKLVICSKSFKLIDFHVCDEKVEKGKPKFAIQMFGVNEQGETCSITIDDYSPFFYVKVGDNWTDADASTLNRELAGRAGSYFGAAITGVELVQHKKLYGFSAGKLHKFAKITFANSSAFNKVKRFWYDDDNRMVSYRFKGIALELYESVIPPLLRYFHIHNISPSGWIQIFTKRATVPLEKNTTCDFEYVCSRESVKPLPEKETRVPYKICSFDIEASSSHGDFPVPVKTYKRLASNIIDIFAKHAPEEARSRELVKRIVMSAFGYDKFDDAELVYPKFPPTQTTVDTLVKQLLQTPIKEAEKMKKAIVRSLFPVTESDQVVEDEEQVDVDIDENDEEEEEEEDDEPRFYKKYEKPARITAKATILDVIYNTDYARDQKLKFIDDVLSAMFPPLEGDKATFIGSTFLKYGDQIPYLNHCLVLGSCDPVDGVIIESVETETDLLLKWAELIQTENPDIIIGYNIFGFDYDFLFRRAQENYCERDFSQLSRRKNEACMKTTQTGEQMIENAKVVLASGEYDLKYFKTPGRLQIDMYTYFRRDFNLSSYKLDDVAGQYIGDDIKKIEIDEQQSTTRLYSKNLTGLNVNDFIHIEITGFTTDYYGGGAKFRVVEIRKEADTNVIIIGGIHRNIDTTKSIRWGMAKDDVSPQDIFRLSNGSSSDRAIVAKYCIQDCNLVHHLANKIDVITGYVEMSRICSVPISFLVFRGQGIKLTSYVAKKCREKNTLMPDLDRSGGNEGYEGAIVLPPKCAMYMDNPVACVDYESLYPSAMISQKYSHDTKVWMKEYDLSGKLVRQTGDPKYDNLPGVEYIDIEFDSFRYERKTPTSKADKVKSGTITCRWAQVDDAIMPSILEELLSARAQTRKMIKTENDPFMQNILDKRQLGYKVTANSLYGQCGAKTSTFYEKDIAASTTATGRMMITYAKRMIEEVYGNMEYETDCHGAVLTKAEYVYGDTDSVFFTFNLQDPKTGENIRGKKALEITIEIAQDVAHLCSSLLKSPMKLAYEKTLMPFLLLSKKRYVGMLYETNPNKGKLKYMGLSLKRRDACDYLKDTYGGILNRLMQGEPTVPPYPLPSTDNEGSSNSKGGGKGTVNEDDKGGFRSTDNEGSSNSKGGGKGTDNEGFRSTVNEDGSSSSKGGGKGEPQVPPIVSAIEFLEKSLVDLISGKVPMDKLTITRALRSDYKNPNQIAHKVLADRIGDRDPGNKPKPGDRIKYVFVNTTNTKALMGNRIETPEFISASKLKIDYTHYITNQLMKPLQQLFGLAVEQIWEAQGKTGAIKTYKKDIASLEQEYATCYETFNKKKEKYCSAKVKTLLFDKVLNQITNEKNKVQMITNFFK